MRYDAARNEIPTTTIRVRKVAGKAIVWEVLIDVVEAPGDAAARLRRRGILAKVVGLEVHVQATDLCTIHYVKHPCPKCRS